MTQGPRRNFSSLLSFAVETKIKVSFQIGNYSEDGALACIPRRGPKCPYPD